MEEKKEYYLEEIGKLFLRYGVSGITMEEIAKKIGISKKTIYNYFDCKADIIELLISRHYKELNKAVLEIVSNANNAIEIFVKIAGLIKETNQAASLFVRRDLIKHFPHIVEKINNDNKTAAFNGIKKNILVGIKQGVYRSNINVELITRIFVNSLNQLMIQEIMEEKEVFIDTYYDEIHSYHIHGIATPKGVEILNEILNANKK